MRTTHVLRNVVVANLVAAGTAIAQTPVNHLALGIAAEQARKPQEGLQHFQAALAQNERDYEANWRAAEAAIDLVQSPDGAADTTRLPADSLYALAEGYARRAVAIAGTRAEGHYIVAFVLGSRSLVSNSLTRLSMASEIWHEATEAIARDSSHDRAYHVLGRWYAELLNLSTFEASYARDELGEIAENATWDLAIKNLEKAVALSPNTIYHHLDLARAYYDTKRINDARAQLDKVDALPITVVQDPDYKAQGKALRARLATTP